MGHWLSRSGIHSSASLQVWLHILPNSRHRKEKDSWQLFILLQQAHLHCCSIGTMFFLKLASLGREWWRRKQTQWSGRGTGRWRRLQCATGTAGTALRIWQSFSPHSVHGSPELLHPQSSEGGSQLLSPCYPSQLIHRYSDTLLLLHLWQQKKKLKYILKYIFKTQIKILCYYLIFTPGTFNGRWANQGIVTELDTTHCWCPEVSHTEQWRECGMQEQHQFFSRGGNQFC